MGSLKGYCMEIIEPSDSNFIKLAPKVFITRVPCFILNVKDDDKVEEFAFVINSTACTKYHESIMPETVGDDYWTFLYTNETGVGITKVRCIYVSNDGQTSECFKTIDKCPVVAGRTLEQLFERLMDWQKLFDKKSKQLNVILRDESVDIEQSIDKSNFLDFIFLEFKEMVDMTQRPVFLHPCLL